MRNVAIIKVTNTGETHAGQKNMHSKATGEENINCESNAWTWHKNNKIWRDDRRARNAKNTEETLILRRLNFSWIAKSVDEAPAKGF